MAENICACCGDESDEELSYGDDGKPLCDNCSTMRYCTDHDGWVDEDDYMDEYSQCVNCFNKDNRGTDDMDLDEYTDHLYS